MQRQPAGRRRLQANLGRLREQHRHDMVDLGGVYLVELVRL